jgi:hypothetical protein
MQYSVCAYMGYSMSAYHLTMYGILGTKLLVVAVITALTNCPVFALFLYA